jgi:hypothetical protein
MTLLQAPPRWVDPTAGVAWQVDESLTTFVDATAEETLSVARRLDLAAPLRRALGALGCAWRLDGAGPAAPTDGVAFEAAEGSGGARLRWEIRVRTSGAGGAALTVTTRYSAPDEPTRDRLRAAWPVVRPLSVTVARRAAQTIRARAEDDRRP